MVCSNRAKTIAADPLPPLHYAGGVGDLQRWLRPSNCPLGILSSLNQAPGFATFPFADPDVAVEAARTLEYITLGGGGGALEEHETDTLNALVSVLYSRGGAAAAGAGAAASRADAKAAAVAFGSGGSAAIAVPALVVKEAAEVLLRIAEAAQATTATNNGVAAAAVSGSGTGGAAGRSRGMASARQSGSGAAAPPATEAPATAAAVPPALPTLQSLPASFAVQLRADAGRDSSPRHQGSSGGGGSGGSFLRQSFLRDGDRDTDGTSASIGNGGAPRPEAVAAGARGGLPPQRWQQLVGRSAPAFQAVASCISEGPWKSVKMQVGMQACKGLCSDGG